MEGVGAISMASPSMELTTTTNVGSAKKPYVSMFRIAGVPILPPLMTEQKRREMQKLKEKAMKFERKLEARRKGLTLSHSELGDICEESDEFSSCCSAPISPQVATQQQLQGEQAQNESIIMLTNLLEEHKASEESKPGPKSVAQSSNCSRSPSITSNEEEDEDGRTSDSVQVKIRTTCKYQKLTKSETVVLDNHNKEVVIMAASRDWTNKRENLAERPSKREINNNRMEKPTSLALSKQIIPSIMINPPTPKTEAASQSYQPRLAEALPKGDSTEEDDDEDYNNYQFEQCHAVMTDTTGFAEHSRTTSPSELEEYVGTGPCRSATSPSLNVLTADKDTSNCQTELNESPASDHSLVRSSSFTIEHPSKALLDHMAEQGAPLSPSNEPRTPTNKRFNNFARHTVESQGKRVNKVETPTRAQRDHKCERNASHSCHPTTYQKPNAANYISPYAAKERQQQLALQQQKASNKSKASNATRPSTNNAIQKSKSSAIVSSNSKSAPLAKPVRTSLPRTHQEPEKPPNALSPEQMLKEIEEEKRRELEELFIKQKEEQRRLEEAFKERHESLLNELTNNLNMDSAAGSQDVSPATSRPASSQASPTRSTRSRFTSDPSRVSSPGNGSLTARYSSRRRQSYTNNAQQQPPATTARRDLNANDIFKTGSVPFFEEQQPEEGSRRYYAASIINAYVRGYLVRRLFHTEQVQRIVQTIKDTLTFVLNLYMDTVEDPEEEYNAANIKLKARLLQQLSAATRNLHLLFFETSMKERMEIISKDRNRIKAKLLAKKVRRSSLKTLT